MQEKNFFLRRLVTGICIFILRKLATVLQEIVENLLLMQKSGYS
jgi:hypothetical protein